MFEEILNKIDDIVWGVPTIALILVTGIVMTIATRGIQFTKLGRAFKSIFKENEGKGELSGFSALCTALSATIGTGNIVGVATAILAGGPGALFWMWIAALLGTATKYAECMLSIKYREVKEDGHVLGGPFYVIEKGMGKNWKWLAILFAIFGTLVGLFGIGTFTQVNGICGAIQNAFDADKAHIAFSLFGNDYTWATVIGGAIITIATALVVIGGLKRISKVAEKVVPVMAAIFLLGGMIVLIFRAKYIPATFAMIFQYAFQPQAIIGGAFGAALKSAISQGAKRGLFSNEAGMGSTPHAHAQANVSHPHEQGIVALAGVFIDTFVVLTLNALVIISTLYTVDGPLHECGAAAASTVLSKSNLAQTAFGVVFGPKVGAIFVAICLFFFAFSTILSWNMFGKVNVVYLFGEKNAKVSTKIYTMIGLVFIFLGTLMSNDLVWELTDAFNYLMVIPNALALFALTKMVTGSLKEADDQKK